MRPSTAGSLRPRRPFSAAYVPRAHGFLGYYDEHSLSVTDSFLWKRKPTGPAKLPRGSLGMYLADAT